MGAGKTDIAIVYVMENQGTSTPIPMRRGLKFIRDTQSRTTKLGFPSTCAPTSVTGLCMFKLLFQQFDNTSSEPTSNLKLEGICNRGSLKVFLE